MTITITRIHPDDAYYPDREDFEGLTVQPVGRITDMGGGWYSLTFGTGAAEVTLCYCRIAIN
jgi:hypothetical protein